MDVQNIVGIVGGAIGALSVPINIFAVRYARTQARIAERAAQAADRAANAAELEAQATHGALELETERHRAALTPTFTVTAAQRNEESSRIKLMIRLTGPLGLPKLDSVVVKIRTDPSADMPSAPDPVRLPHRPGIRITERVSPPPSRRAASSAIPSSGRRSPQPDVVWAPFRVAHERSEGPSGDTSVAFSLRNGEQHTLLLEPTSPAPNREYRWPDLFGDTPIRLELECQWQAFTWTLLDEVAQPAAKFVMDTREGPGYAFVWFTNAGNATARNVRVFARPDDTMKTPEAKHRRVGPGALTDEIQVAPTLDATAVTVTVIWADLRGARHEVSKHVRF